MTVHITQGTLEAIVRNARRRGYAEALMDTAPRIPETVAPDKRSELLKKWRAEFHERATNKYPARSTVIPLASLRADVP